MALSGPAVAANCDNQRLRHPEWLVADSSTNLANAVTTPCREHYTGLAGHSYESSR